MKNHGHRPKVNFDIKMSFNVQAKLKGRGHMLMTKFGKAGKIGLYSLVFRSIRF
jgi:hypothetical protein